MKILKNNLHFILAFSFLFSLVLMACCPKQPIKKVTGIARCLIVSDIHFNPFYDTTLVSKLSTTTYDKWDSLFKTSKVPYDFATMYGHDSNYGLLMSTINSMKAQFDAKHPPAFIILAGDFIWHGSAEPPAIAKMPAAAKNLLKTNAIRYLAQLFRASFPHIHIIPLLGNNDTDMGNYHQQSPAFLNAFTDAWEKGGPDTYDNSLRNNGYYTCHPATVPNLKFVIINSSLLGFNPYLAKPFPDSSAMKMLAWLGSELHTAQKNGNEVWILSHIPPGKNVHDSTEMWRNDYSQQFVDTVAKYARSGNNVTIRAIIASHIHRNDFRVIANATGPAVYIRTVPSVSPVYGNNPSYEIAEVDQSTNAIVNEKTYYFDLPNSAKQWNNTFDLRKQLSLSAIDAEAFNGLVTKFKTDTTGLAAYINFFNVGAVVKPAADPHNLSNSNYKVYLGADVLMSGK